jgi:hypothetical protein
MRVPNRVHIIPLGYEYDRVIEPPSQLKADVVVLVYHHSEDTVDAAHETYSDAKAEAEPETKNEAGAGAQTEMDPEGGSQSESEPPYYADIRDQLDDIARVERAECDLFDMYSCLDTIVRQISNYRDEEVYVNLATGSKVTAIAGMIACMATDATPYYVRASRYGDDEEGPPSKPVSRDVTGIDQLPTYPIDPPSDEQIRVLEYLDSDATVTKKNLIAFGDQESLPFLAGYDSESEKGKYRRLDTHILDRLSEDGYVTTERVGRTTRVHLTDEGENTARAFCHLVE